MKTIVILEISHSKEVPALANMIAGRAYTIAGVTNAQVFGSPSQEKVDDNGFTLRELSLGSREVVSL